MAFRVVTHDETLSQKYRDAAVFFARFRKCATKIRRDEWDMIREMALHGELDTAEDMLTTAVTGEKRVKPNQIPPRRRGVR